MARIVRFIQALRTRMLVLFHTPKYAFWNLLLVMLIIYVFGIVFTLVGTSKARSDPRL